MVDLDLVSSQTANEVSIRDSLVYYSFGEGEFPPLLHYLNNFLTFV